MNGDRTKLARRWKPRCPRDAHSKTLETLETLDHPVSPSRLVFQGLTNEIPRNFSPLFVLTRALVHLSPIVALRRRPKASPPARVHGRYSSHARRRAPVSTFRLFDVSTFSHLAPTHARHDTCNRPKRSDSPYVTLQFRSSAAPFPDPGVAQPSLPGEFPPLVSFVDSRKSEIFSEPTRPDKSTPRSGSPPAAAVSHRKEPEPLRPSAPAPPGSVPRPPDRPRRKTRRTPA